MVIFNSKEKQYFSVIHNHNYSILKKEHSFDLMQLDLSNKNDINLLWNVKVSEKDWEKYIKDLGEVVKYPTCTMFLDSDF